MSSIDASALLPSITTQLPAALQASLPAIANADVLTASVRSQCVAGRATLVPSTDITGLTVLGTAVDPDSAAAQTLSLDTTGLTLGQLVSTNDVLKSITVRGNQGTLLGTLLGGGDRNLYTLLTQPGGLLGQLTSGLPTGTTVKSILDGLSTAAAPVLQTKLSLSPDLLRVTVTPNATTNDGSTATATTLQLSASVLGKPVLSGAVARASLTASAVNCSGTTTKDKDKDPRNIFDDSELLGTTYASIPSQLQLQCEDAPPRLTDVARSGSRTLVTGVAQKRFVGKSVDIILAAGKKKVGKATVKADGTFTTKVALPPSKIRSTNAARCYGVVSGSRSNKLKFERRMEITKLTSSGGNVTMKGQITLPRLAKQKPVVLQRRVTCSKYVKVGSAPRQQGPLHRDL